MEMGCWAIAIFFFYLLEAESLNPCYNGNGLLSNNVVFEPKDYKLSLNPCFNGNGFVRAKIAIL